MLQQIALGGTMIALPIYLQMVLEYNAMQAGLSLAPLSLSMFAVALLAGQEGGQPPPEQHHPRRVRARSPSGMVLLIPIVPAGRLGLVAGRPADHRRVRARPAGVPAQQLHAVADLRGAGQRGGRRELGGRLVRAVVRAGVRGRASCWRRSRSRSPSMAEDSTVLPPAEQQQVANALEDDAEVMSNTQLEELLAGQPAAIQDEIIRINTDARPLALQVALLIPILAALIGLFVAFRMMRLPDPTPSSATEGMAWDSVRRRGGTRVPAERWGFALGAGRSDGPQVPPTVVALRSRRRGRSWRRSSCPQGMAYAELAGLPPVTGLYTTIACLVGYAVDGAVAGAGARPGLVGVAADLRRHHAAGRRRRRPGEGDRARRDDGRAWSG